MKNIRFARYLLVLLVPVFCFGLCNKEEADNGDPDSILNWTVNNVNYTSANGAWASVVSASTTQIYGVKTGASNISLNLTDCNAPGTWIAGHSSLPGFNAFVLLEVSNGVFESTYNTGDEKVTIIVNEVNSTKIKGTFTGVLTQSGGAKANVSGNFDVRFER